MLRAQQLLHQRMQHFLLCSDAKKMFFDAFARADLRHLIPGGQFVMDPFGGGKNPHAGSAESFEQGAVFKFAHQIRFDTQPLEPLIESAAHSRLCCRQQDRHCPQRSGEILRSQRVELRRWS